MLPYLANLVIVVLAVWLARRSRNSFQQWMCFGIAFLSMVLLAGLRDRRIGTDTGGYVWYFSEMRTFSDLIHVTSNMGEYGFWFVTWIAHLLSSQYAVFLTLIAGIVVSLYMRAIREQTVNLEVSVFVFIAMGVYSTFFNTARQSVAAAIFAVAIAVLVNGKVIRYLVLVGVAFLFHKSSLVLLPAYWICNRPNTWKNMILFLFIGVVMALSFQFIVQSASSLDERYAGYQSNDAGGGYVYVGFQVLLAVFFVIFKGSVSAFREEYERYLNVYLLGVTIGIVAVLSRADPSGPLRLMYYFTFAAVLLWPIVFANIKDRTWRMVTGYVFILGYIIYFIGTTERFADLTPYRLNATLFGL
jgi:hypothetical protein